MCTKTVHEALKKGRNDQCTCCHKNTSRGSRAGTNHAWAGSGLTKHIMKTTSKSTKLSSSRITTGHDLFMKDANKQRRVFQLSLQTCITNIKQTRRRDRGETGCRDYYKHLADKNKQWREMSEAEQKPDHDRASAILAPIKIALPQPDVEAPH